MSVDLEQFNGSTVQSLVVKSGDGTGKKVYLFLPEDKLKELESQVSQLQAENKQLKSQINQPASSPKEPSFKDDVFRCIQDACWFTLENQGADRVDLDRFTDNILFTVDKHLPKRESGQGSMRLSPDFCRGYNHALYRVKANLELPRPAAPPEL